MIYPANFEQKIGFDRLRAQVAALCTMRAARERVEAQVFTCDEAEIVLRQSLADEMRRLLDLERDFPGEEFADVDAVTAKIRIEGAFLEVAEVLVLRRALAAAGAVAGFIRARGAELYPRLRELSAGVEGFPGIVQEIDRLIDRFGQVKDTASPGLHEVRRAIREREGQAAKRLQQVLAAAKSAGIVEADAQLSIRDGRAVIPVAAANKRKLQGFIHDESATGRTFYVEPVEVVEINNELRELEYAERREIVRILTAFTASVRPEADRIEATGDYLADIDMLRAKARWASENGCVKPILSTDDRLVLRSARHPLLAQTLRAQGRAIVPLDMQLDRAKRILVISGPNAGGKSVCLKTTGIVQYMFQCGFPVPASEVSELPVFRSLFIDIGDEQSIDDDLSTYSSHLRNMKHMLAGASERTLVLIDEFGSGTEPVIGGAIAEAILERLLERGCYGVITTHYANIKYYASNTEGIANGAMMFDVQQIRPLFRLETGKPGSSFAIEIARKIGLPEEIIRAAGEKAGSDHINIEKQLVAEANRQIELTIRTIREAQAEKELTRLARRELEEFRERTEQADAAAESERAAQVEREMARIERRRHQRRRAAGGPEVLAVVFQRLAHTAQDHPFAVGEALGRGALTEGAHGVAGHGGRGACDQGRQGAGGFRADPDHGRDGEPHRGVEQRIPRGHAAPDPAHGGVGGRGVAQAQLPRPHRRARHAGLGGRGGRAGPGGRRAHGGRGFGDHSARQGHRCAEGGDTPLPAHGVRNRLGRRRTCRPRRRRNYHRYF